jgi:hypothetical protein
MLELYSNDWITILQMVVFIYTIHVIYLPTGSRCSKASITDFQSVLFK